jgi:hypothetical protein
MNEWAIEILDVSTNTRIALTPLSAAQDDLGAEFVTDDFIVYQRIHHTVAGSEMRARWRGWDGTWATPDDVDWAFDTATIGFSDPRASEGEVSYFTILASGAREVHHCDFFVGSAHPCVSGFVAVEPPVFAALSDAHPVPVGVTLLVRQLGTDWLDPGQPPQNWISEPVVDTLALRGPQKTQ